MISTILSFLMALAAAASGPFNPGVLPGELPRQIDPDPVPTKKQKPTE